MSEETKKQKYNGIVDFHTHILPRMDDGSRSTDESVEMLNTLSAQGVSSVVSTSHFYPRRESPTDFIERREKSLSSLRLALTELRNDAKNAEIALPRIYVGAEVAYFSGMCISPDIPRLCVKGTKLLLVEMPFEKWSLTMTDDLCYIKEELELTPVVAHIDRYIGMFSARALDKLKSCGVLMQANASSLLHFSTRSKVLKLIEEGYISVIGSDCHNMDKRAPNIGLAFEVIEKKLGAHAVIKIINESSRLLDGADPLM